MADHRRIVREWALMLAVLSAVIFAAGYAASKRLYAGAAIRELESLACLMSDTAMAAELGVLSQGRAQELDAAQKDLERRMAESLKPGLVQADLMASAASAGLVVQEIQPMAAPAAGRPADKEAALANPRYRVWVRGAYARLAEYMHQLAHQRHPARVVEFRVIPASADDRSTGRTSTGAEATLDAEITVESFVPFTAGRGSASSPVARGA